MVPSPTPSGSFLVSLDCPGCHRTFPPDQVVGFCEPCARTLVARYDMDRVRDRLSPDLLRSRPPDFWRFAELLPPVTPRHRASLGEVETPILRIEDPELAGTRPFWVKHDGYLPTGTFKARGMAMAVSRAWELGVQSLFVPSAGNAGAALAAYARRAGIPALVFMPEASPAAAQEQVLHYGGELRKVPGHIGDAGRIGREEAARRKAFDVSTLREPYRAEGKKTMGLELFWQLGREGLPDAIVYPTGGGTGLVGMFRAFTQLRELGWISQLPRLYAAQAEGCAPVVEALQRDRSRVEAVADPRTDAAGLRVPSPFSSEEILEAVRRTGGAGIAVPERKIEPAALALGARHGLSVARETGAALAGLRLLLDAGTISRDERVVVYCTGLWAG